MKTPGERDLSLDILRSGAILYVVGFWHLQEYSSSLNFFSDITLLLTDIVLALFVYISGYLLSSRYDLIGVTDLFPFFRKRMLRIYPMYLGALTIFAVIHLISPGVALRASFLANMITGETLRTLWFVGLILCFYLITPIFLYRFSPVKTVAYSAGLFTLLLVIDHRTGYIDLRLAQYLPAFVMGILVARVSAMEGLLKSRVLLVLSLVPLVGGFFAFSRFADQYFRLFISIVTFLAALGILLYLGRVFSRFCGRRLVGFFAYSSYAVYLLHRISFAVGKRFFRPEGLVPSFLYLVGLILPLTIIMGYFIQKAYDRLIVDRLTGRS
ncbi:MAG: acyltransferase family protein [Candidatus Krumholzibacteria bacterium]|nr:acyltransferase family protein [Candidatus Krumholzibacteria bacterium]